MSLINATVAFHNAQTTNRNNWLKHTISQVSNQINYASKQGLRFLELDNRILYQGAENLLEIGEMVTLLHQEFIKAGYKVVVTPDCRILVQW